MISINPLVTAVAADQQVPGEAPGERALILHWSGPPGFDDLVTFPAAPNDATSGDHIDGSGPSTASSDSIDRVFLSVIVFRYLVRSKYPEKLDYL